MNLKLKGYLKETRRPVYSAALVLPFLIVYHIGTLLFHTTYINGADALIIRLLSSLSVHSMFGSLLVLAAFFVIWQLRTRAIWKIKTRMMLLYFLESVCFAMLLVLTFGWMTHLLSLAAQGKTRGIVKLALFCGAGIYEELVFRAFLLTILIVVFERIFRFKKGTASAAAVIVGALLFSAFHYIGEAGDVFTLSSFIQRTAGGLYFSILYVTRGFGVTAAAHSFYDIIIGVILA
jgi:membrane protease YdiL (CAAX protease family)